MRVMQTPLDSQPKIAELVGRYVGQFNVLEGLVQQLCATICRLNQPLADAIFREQMMGQRISVLEALMKATIKSDDEKEAWEILARIKIANSQRNDFAHRLYLAGGADGVTLYDRKKGRSAKLDEQTAAQALEEIALLNGAVTDLYLKWVTERRDFRPLVFGDPG